MKIKNIFYYVQGHIRYILYYSKLKFLIRKKVRDTIYYRIIMMKRECFERGSCVMCGCKTTQLQMSNKSCEGNCYPPM